MILAYKRKMADIAVFGELKMIEAVSSFSRKNYKIRISLIIAAFSFLFVSAARLQLGTKLVEMKQKGADIVLAVDVSTSMLAEDSASGTSKENRLEEAKLLLFDLIQNLGSNRIGIIAFAGTAFWQCPLTLDISSVNLFLDIMDANLIPLPGTAIGSALRLSVKGLSKTAPKSKAVILITDGEDHKSSPIQAAKEAAKEGIKIYPIGFGNPEGEPIPLKNAGGDFAGYKKDKKGEVVMSKLDESLLTEIASLTGGKYYRAKNGKIDIGSLISNLKGLKKQELSAFTNREYEDRYQYPLFIAFILLLTELLIPENKKREKT